MAELALGVLGSVGVLGQIFNGCISAYRTFTAASNIGRDSEKLVCKIKIEEMRLTVWGREWGVQEGKLEGYLEKEKERGNARLREVAIEVLQNLHRTITETERLKGRYGLREGQVEVESENFTGEGKMVGNGKSVKGRPKAGEKWRASSSDLSVTQRLKSEMTLRAKWVIADKEKFQIFLADLKDYNDGLEQLFPPTRLATLQMSWQNELLQAAQRDLKQLGLLEQASNGNYPRLKVGAELKQLRINLDNKSDHNFKPTYALKVRTDLLEIGDQKEHRSLGMYKNPNNDGVTQDVVIEWVPYDKEDVEARFTHMRRIDDLARMVHSASARHPDLHTIDCIGYFDDSDKHRYGVVYSPPRARFTTLCEYISSKEHRTPNLEDRFDLAHTMCVALWSLHSLDWLHKSVCCQNILFFPPPTQDKETTKSSSEAPDISSPVLLGFDASRPFDLVEMSAYTRSPSTLDLHRHPLSLPGVDKKPFCKAFDIYSLGLVLLEIGLWKALKGFWKPHYEPQRFKDRVVLGALVQGLGSKVGRRYKGVVERCLTFGDQEVGIVNLDTHRLMEEIVGVLEGLKV